jgi:hypothetical protein
VQLVLAGIAKHGAYVGHMATGAGQNMSFYIIVYAGGITAGWIDRGLTNILDKHLQASRQLFVVTAQAAIQFRIASLRYLTRQHKQEYNK